MDLDSSISKTNADIARCLSVMLPVFDKVAIVVTIGRRGLEQRPRHHLG